MKKINRASHQVSWFFKQRVIKLKQHQIGGRLMAHRTRFKLIIQTNLKIYQLKRFNTRTNKAFAALLLIFHHLKNQTMRKIIKLKIRFECKMEVDMGK